MPSDLFDKISNFLNINEFICIEKIEKNLKENIKITIERDYLI